MNSINNNWFEQNPKKTFLVLILTTLFFIEIVIRIFFPHLTDFDDKNVQPNKKVFKDYTPNIVFLRTPSKYDSFPITENQINSYGIRGAEIQPKKNYRVLNIGDSFIQADEITFSETFGEKLNKFFNGKIEFISHGLGSYSPTPEFSWIIHKGLPLNIDEVNMFLCVNDFFRSEVYGGSDKNYRDAANYVEGLPLSYNVEEPKVDGYFKTFLKKIEIVRLSFFTYINLRNFIHSFNQENKETVDYPLIQEMTYYSKEFSQWPIEVQNNFVTTFDVIKKTNQFLKEKNIKFNLLVVTNGFRYKDEIIYGKQSETYGWNKDFTLTQDGFEAAIKDFSKKNSITYIELTPSFDMKKKSSSNKLFNEMDGHWNKYGHEVVFEVLKNKYNVN